MRRSGFKELFVATVAAIATADAARSRNTNINVWPHNNQSKSWMPRYITGGSLSDDAVDGPDRNSESDLVPVSPVDTGSTVKKTRQSLQDQANSGTNSNRMPSIFLQPEEQYLDKYSACLAATEGLRKLRDSAIESSRSNKGNKLAGVKTLICGPDANTNDPDYQQACAEYLMNSSKVIRALGLSVAQFNRIGRELSSDPLLKEKVLEQAYLYRITATLNMNKVPLMQDPSSEEMLRATKRHRVQMFARSMTEIEELRLEQMEKLKRALRLEQLPKNLNISDPRIRPLLNPKVRAVVEAFPHQAEDIVRKYGLNSDEFNKMLDETHRNPVFRWKVKNCLDKKGPSRSRKSAAQSPISKSEDLRVNTNLENGSTNR